MKKTLPISHISLGIITDVARNILRKKVLMQNNFKPLLACYLVTYDCNYNCEFCSRLPEETLTSIDEGIPLSLEEAYDLLSILRKSTRSLYISGGEPLLYPNIKQILQFARNIGYKPISLNTNASLLNNNLDLLKFINILVVSLYTLDVKKMSRISRIPESLAKKAIDNIKNIAKIRQKKKIMMIINCVIFEENINDIYQLVDFCKQYDLKLSLTPKMDKLPGGCNVNNSLINNDAYKQLISYLRQLKREKNSPLINSAKYYDIINELKPLPNCIPSLVPCISPNGGVYFPCPEKKHKVCENIIKAGSYEAALKKAATRIRFKNCSHTNFKPGNIEPSLLINNPITYIRTL